ncbi:hypothetical protein F5050DRAFT_1811934 [Lentinula boryana]|uniref:DNA helicase n=1 Tax=Lentinula boryana TaxID=40481 RepID=A0ABQ8PZZ1_9AGAR|nr:hypothetical protein F5050DRAFT_1811934 [Lentinula boryana]
MDMKVKKLKDRQVEADKSNIVYGTGVASVAPSNDDDAEADSMAATRVVNLSHFALRMRYERSVQLSLEPGLKLVRFKQRDAFRFEDNVKHSQLIYPEETVPNALSALLEAMFKKKVKERNDLDLNLLESELDSQEEGVNEMEPPSFHIIPLPLMDDIRSVPIEQRYIASNNLKESPGMDK